MKDNTVRIPAPTTPGCQAIQIDGRDYPVKNGYATYTGFRANELRHIEDTLPANTWSLSNTNQPELRCINCKRKKLALFGDVCAWCGGHCEALVDG